MMQNRDFVYPDTWLISRQNTIAILNVFFETKGVILLLFSLPGLL